MGAGFDSRAIRFYSPQLRNIKVFETDTVHTQNVKARQLEKRGIKIPENNIYVSIDFDKENLKTRLDDNNYNLERKTLFILEGLTMYLSENSINETFKVISGYPASGSLIVFDYIYASVLRREGKYYGEEAIYKRVKKENEKWTYGIEEEQIDDFLNSFNYSLVDHLDSLAIEKKYFTDESGTLIAKVNGTHCIVLAQKN